MASIFLLIIVILGFLARSRVVIVSGIILLLFKELKIYSVLDFFSNKGIEIGLVFLLLAILSSMISSPLNLEQLKLTLLSKEGLIAVIAGLLATKFNGLGLNLLKDHPQIIIGIIIGSLLGIAFFGGIPVGPLMAAGIAAFFLELLALII